MAVFICRGTYKACLGWPAARRVDVRTRLPNLESLYRGINWVESHTHGPAGLNTASLSQCHVLGAASGSPEVKQNAHPKDGRGRGISSCPGPAHGSTGALHDLPQLSTPHVSSHHLTRLPPLLHCALRRQQGVSRGLVVAPLEAMRLHWRQVP